MINGQSNLYPVYHGAATELTTTNGLGTLLQLLAIHLGLWGMSIYTSDTFLPIVNSAMNSITHELVETIISPFPATTFVQTLSTSNAESKTTSPPRYFEVAELCTNIVLGAHWTSTTSYGTFSYAYNFKVGSAYYLLQSIMMNGTNTCYA